MRFCFKELKINVFSLFCNFFAIFYIFFVNYQKAL